MDDRLSGVLAKATNAKDIFVNAEKKLRYVFDFFDYDHGGTINEKELVGLLALLEERNGTVLHVDELMKQFSKSEHQELEFKDVLELLGHCQKLEDIKPKARDIFAFFDRSGTEYITKSDLLRTMSVLGEDTCDQEVEELMREAQAPISGGIDENKFYELLYDLDLIEKPSSSCYLQFDRD
eukprot:Plantae.Rhodophyta-Purpureofilum_apyrenoidigerum.ctg21444.p2 GENE.Plantae.Rhodophyta-Purpureofilum_apyrenoidigerum.ctg21444~~Plantae.Rhodophyta-Purpureofilum_apyrenoidigerum.ctg21444.p2  ORF type:complete len:181 (+),score=58.65 Plantae.Rhodophyta-Purpureofilum_apyrenoidigerum.ctg21444:84-626(+)